MEEKGYSKVWIYRETLRGMAEKIEQAIQAAAKPDKNGDIDLGNIVRLVGIYRYLRKRANEPPEEPGLIEEKKKFPPEEPGLIEEKKKFPLFLKSGR